MTLADFRQEGIVVWGWIAWTILVLVVWLVVGALLGTLIGRVIRRRNQQVAGGASDAVPAPRQAVDDTPHAQDGARSAGRHAPRRP